MALVSIPRRLKAGIGQGCVVLGLLAACSGSPVPDMPEYAPAEPFIEEFNRVQSRKAIYEDYANRQRSQAVRKANARNWAGWLRINRARELGLNEQAYRANAERVYDLTTREFQLREWNIHRNRKVYGDALAAQRAAEIARNSVRSDDAALRQYAAMQSRIRASRALEAQRNAERARLAARRGEAARQTFQDNRAIFEAQAKGDIPPVRNARGQIVVEISPQERAQYAAALARMEELRRNQELARQQQTGEDRLRQQAADRAAFAEVQVRIQEGLQRQRAAFAERNRANAAALIQRQQSLGLAPAPVAGQGGQAQGAQQAPAVINVQPPVQQAAN